MYQEQAYTKNLIGEDLSSKHSHKKGGSNSLHGDSSTDEANYSNAQQQLTSSKKGNMIARNGVSSATSRKRALDFESMKRYLVDKLKKELKKSVKAEVKNNSGGSSSIYHKSKQFINHNLPVTTSAKL